jgi:hypothetical protein
MAEQLWASQKGLYFTYSEIDPTTMIHECQNTKLIKQILKITTDEDIFHHANNHFSVSRDSFLKTG